LRHGRLRHLRAGHDLVQHAVLLQRVAHEPHTYEPDQNPSTFFNSNRHNTPPLRAWLYLPSYFFFAAYGLLGARRGGCGRGRAHLRLELLHQLARPKLLGLFFDLESLLVDVPHGHFHAGLVDRGHLFDFAHHLVVRLADTGDFELLHRI